MYGKTPLRENVPYPLPKKDLLKKIKSKKGKKNLNSIMTLLTVRIAVTPTRMMGPAIVVFPLT